MPAIRYVEPLLPPGPLRFTDAETGIYSAEGWDRLLSGWEVVRDNTVAHAGSWSWLVAGDSLQKGSGWNLPTYVSGTWFLVRFWVRIAALPGASRALGLGPAGGNNVMAGLTLNTDGTLQGDTTGTFGFAINKSAALVPGNWHKLEFAGRSDASSGYNWLNGIWRLDGVEFQRHCGRPAKGAFNRMYASTSNGAPHVNVDDMVVNDDRGSSLNYWNDGTKPLSTGKTQPSVRSVGTTATNTSNVNSIVVNAPPTIAVGDVLAMIVELQTSTPGTFTLPSGWTQRVAFGAAGGTLLTATKVATGSEPSTYTTSWSFNASRGHAVCYALAGVNANPVIDVQALTLPVSNTDTGFMFPALDLSEGDALILQAVSMIEATTKTLTTPAWWTNATNLADTTNGQALACGFFGQADGGLTATGLMSATASISGSVAVAAIAFRAGSPPQSIVPSGIASAQALGTPTVTRGTVSIAPPGIASAQALGTPTVRGAVSIVPSGIASAQALGTPTVTPGPVVVQPTGIASAQAFGATRIAVTIQPSGIASGQAFGVAVVAIKKVIRPAGIPSSEAWGRKRQIKVARVRTTTAIIAPTGIASAQAVGHPTVSTGVIFVRPVGIEGAEAFGLGGIGRPVILPAPTGTGPLPLMLIRRSGLRH